MAGSLVMRGPCLAYRSSGIAVTCGQCAVGAAARRALAEAAHAGYWACVASAIARWVFAALQYTCVARRACVRLRALGYGAAR